MDESPRQQQEEQLSRSNRTWTLPPIDMRQLICYKGPAEVPRSCSPFHDD